MSSNPRNESGSSPAEELAEVLYFDSGDGRLFGWLHHPLQRAHHGIGLVICNPFGYEAICSHRSLRVFAETAASIGVPTLRFDYVGTGDSSDIDDTADQMSAWTMDVIAAVAELRRRADVERVCVLGVRLGATLAARAAAQSDSVSSLILIAPVISGRRYLRELRMTQMAGSMFARYVPPPDSDAEDSNKPGHVSFEVSGFSLSPATLASLGQLNIASIESPTLSSILVIDGDKMPVSRSWAEGISHGKPALRYEALPGLVEMVMTAPQFASIPHAMIAAMRSWLFDLAGSTHGNSTRRSHVGEPVDTVSDSLSLALPAGDGAALGAITERPLFLRSKTLLFGIVTEPRENEGRRRAVILLNAGVDHHIGASRMYVSLARRWARHGYFVLRLDLSGIGDSATQKDSANDDVFPSNAQDDIRIAIDHLRSRYTISDLTLAGLCSGAYHALRAAAMGASVSRILLVNPQNYFWKSGMTISELQLAEVVHNPQVYRERMVSYEAWRRLLSGHVNIWRIATIYMHRMRLAGESILREFAHQIHIRLPDDLGWELEEIVNRGVRIVFLFARGEPGIELLKLQGGSTVKKLADRCRVHIFDFGDHVFSQAGPRSVMEEVLSEELFKQVKKP